MKNVMKILNENKKCLVSLMFVILLLTPLFSGTFNLGGNDVIDNQLINIDNVQPSALDDNYAEALQKAIYFYVQQRSGVFADTNPAIWRGDSTVNDGSDIGADLSGGYYDAGDHVKFNLPMASSFLTIGWSVYENRNAYVQTNQLDEVLDTIKYATDYFIDCHTAVNEYVYQVGSGSADHTWWGPVECIEVEMARPSYKVTMAAGGSAVVGATSAALAMASLIFEDTNPTYAAECLSHAVQLYEFAYATQSDGGYIAASGFYNSWSGFWDELANSAIILYMKTGDSFYLTRAEEASTNWNVQQQETFWEYKWGHSWDDMHYMAQILLSRYTSKSIYIESTERNLDWWMPGGGITYTPGGLAWLDSWGSNRYAANTALLAFIWAREPSCTESKRVTYQNFAEKQIRYICGENPRSSSYIIGFGDNSPQNPHHRTAHGSWLDSQNTPTDTRHVLYGALVGGPGTSDNYIDVRSDFTANEVALDYNSGLVGALAEMTSLYGGSIIPGFPLEEHFRPESERYEEIYVNGGIQGEQFHEIVVKLMLSNHAGWPARLGDKLSYRYFLDLSELAANGASVADVEVGTYYVEGNQAKVTGPHLWEGDIYYVEVDYTGASSTGFPWPGGQSEHEMEIQLRIGISNSFPTGTWDATNDWSYQTLSGDDVNIPVYDDGALIWGNTPAHSGAAPSAPSGLSLVDTNPQAYSRIDWNDNSESDVSFYKIYRSTVSGFAPSANNLIDLSVKSSYVDVGLTPGETYYYKIAAVDDTNIESSSSTQLSATIPTEGTANTAPSINHPADFTYIQYSTGNMISWIATDINPATYTITRDGTSVDSGTWTSGSAISINVDDLDTGIYTYIITVLDSEGLSTSDSVEVGVIHVEPIAPYITGPENIIYQEGDTTSYSISWTIADDDPGTYTITGPAGTSNPAPYTNGGVITESVGGLAIGIHTYTITATDLGGLSSSDSVDVVVTYVPTGGDVTIQTVSDIKVGDIFDTTVYVDTGIQKVAAYGIDITFDPTILQVNSVVASPDGFTAAINIDNTLGKITVAGFEATGKGPSAVQDLFIINWEALAEGNSVIGITVNDLTDETTATIGIPNGIDGSITVVPAYDLGDVNHDGSVSIIDALLVAQFYVGDSVVIDETLADVNKDGSITIVDALLIAQFYVGQIPALPPQ